MITILKKPKTKKVKLFKCPCGCEFTAEDGDYIFVNCHSIPKLSSYRIECPICHITHVYLAAQISEIEVNIE